MTKYTFINGNARLTIEAEGLLEVMHRFLDLGLDKYEWLCPELPGTGCVGTFLDRMAEMLAPV